VREATTLVASFISAQFIERLELMETSAMRLLILMLLLLLVPLFALWAAVFAVGAALRLLFILALMFAAGSLLFGRSLFSGFFRVWKFRSRWLPSRSCRRFDARPYRDSDSSAFDDYRRASLRKLEEEAKDFRTFLAKLKARTDAADFENFLRARRASGPHNS
jgi:hypothetical protein